MNPDKTTDWQRLFDILHIPIQAHTPTGAPSFADAVLKKIDHDIVQKARRAGKLASIRSKSSYCPIIKSLEKMLNSDLLFIQLRGDEYGTVRGRFSMSGASKATGQFGANLQQVPACEQSTGGFWVQS